MGDLYDWDVLEWSQQQVRVLRQIAAGEAGAEVPDWPRVIEEIEALGRAQLSRVRTALVRAVALDFRCEAWPLARQVPQWRADAREHRNEAAEAFTPSMRPLIDMKVIYAAALALLPESLDDQLPLPVPPVCPVTLNEMLAGLP